MLGGPRRARLLARGIDEAVSGFVETLDRLGVLDDTYIIYLSDNGIPYGEHGIFGRKNLPYEESLRIPMLIRGPGIPVMTTVDLDVLNIDVAPTIAELAGIPAPGVDGRSFAGLIGRGSAGAWRRSFLAEHLPTDETTGRPLEIHSLVTQRYFYTEWGNGLRELYDRVRDPHQLDNIYDLTSPLIRAVLKARLEYLRQCVGPACA
ncbi:MAG TPA: sulfatase/phosphatase domain-containing protein [Longimicrobiales bacterium]|nr:sulfatase/phosphatase domain-containing protein [Longimicrobiales bacterium]